ncbi:MAG TPA: hypothetical protein VHV78_03895 [Gemmatimonadaceae bacterium]|nr:hypothetical protein [Gemmatimonadaceae bacterium]
MLNPRTITKSGSAVILAAAALGVVRFEKPAPAPTEPFAAIANRALSAGATIDAFGTSRELRVRFTLPDSAVDFPLEVSGDPTSLSYEWISIHDSLPSAQPEPLSGSSFVSPSAPGFYRLAIIRGAEREIIPEPTLAVMVPFEQKVGAKLNGYKIGTYLAERFGHHDHPAGFLEVRESDVDLKVSTHLKLGDFVTHDAQASVWPKYVALSPRLLDKLELVLAKIGSTARLSTTFADPPELAFDVHSGFRTPAHNAGVWRSARDSRHQYGDAADVAVDTDGDGKVTLKDEIVVAHAVDQVEEEHPELVGGLGLYVSRHYRTPYVHIDARGKRSRWKG